jgi:DNA primase
MFPIDDRNGKIIAFGGRLLEGEGPKYLNTGDLPRFSKGANLYAFHTAKAAIRTEKAVIFCEGYMDVLAYHQCGVTIAVAPLGTALTEQQVHLVAGFVDTVYLSFDGDSAGSAATLKAILLCRKAGLAVRVIKMEGGKDPAEIMQKKGEKYLTNWKKDSILDCDFLLSNLTQEYPVDTPEGKTKAALAFFPYLDALKTDMQKQSSLDMACQVLNLRPEAMLHDYNNRDATRRRAEIGQPSQSQSGVPPHRAPPKLNAELRILLSVLANFQWFRELRSALSVDDFDDPLAKELYIDLEDSFRKDSFSPGTFLDHFRDDPGVREMLEKALMSEEYAHMDAGTLEESIKRMRRSTLEKKRASLLNEIRGLRAHDSEEQKRMDELLSEKQSIDLELAK